MKDFHCYLQPQEVPYCSISVYSDRSDVAIDTFLFNQPCEGDLGSFFCCFGTRRFAFFARTDPTEAVFTADLFAHERESSSCSIPIEFITQYLKHLIKCYVIHSKTHTHSAYLQHIREVVASLSSYFLSSFFSLYHRYQLPNPRTLSSNPTFESISIPDRKEQQRILLPYRQSLLVSLELHCFIYVDHTSDSGGIANQSMA